MVLKGPLVSNVVASNWENINSANVHPCFMMSFLKLMGKYKNDIIRE